jgi:nitrite reductase/ring-hydroxylating ferredoxin subunit
MPRIRVCAYNEVPEGGLKKVKVDEQSIALYKLNGAIYATSNICTHEGCFIDENHVIHNDLVECICHGSQFEIKTGHVVLPPAVISLPIYNVEVIGDEIFLDK